MSGVNVNSPVQINIAHYILIQDIPFGVNVNSPEQLHIAHYIFIQDIPFGIKNTDSFI